MKLVKWTPQTLSRWSPMSDFADIDKEFNQLMSWAFGDREDGSLDNPRVAPAMDVVEEKDHYVVQLDLPGLGKDDIEVTFEDGVLTIKGEKKSETEEKKKDYYFRERRFGSFTRSFRIPDSIDEDKIKATFDKGVLEVVLPKRPEAKAKSKKIAISKGK